MEALYQLAPECLQRLEVLCGLDALADDLHPEVVREPATSPGPGTTPERDTTTGDDRRFDRSPTADDTRTSDRAER